MSKIEHKTSPPFPIKPYLIWYFLWMKHFKSTLQQVSEALIVTLEKELSYKASSWQIVVGVAVHRGENAFLDHIL